MRLKYASYSFLIIMAVHYNSLNKTIHMERVSVQIPSSCGLSVISTGCGSGKTTSISMIASDKATKSVLIVVPTIDAANELHDRILPNLKTQRMAVLHTGAGSDNVINEYRENPLILEDYEVLIITSARLIIDPYPLFLHYRSGNRQFVLIDEMINFYPPAFSLPDEMIDLITYVDQEKQHNGIKGEKINVSGNTYYRHVYDNMDRMMAAYMASKTVFFGGKKGLSLVKIQTLFDHVLSSGLVPFRNRIVDLANETTVVLLDGTSDLIFGTDKRVMPISGFRYNSDITFIQYQTPLKRKNGSDWNMLNLNYYLYNLVEILKNETEKTLIVTWKTIDKFPANAGNADDFERLPVRYDFPQELTQFLVSEGIPEDKFSVIYRGSGLDRGSNDYRDYANVIFLGEWNIPDNIVYDINSMFDCKCRFEDYKKALLVQSICRTRIRQHSGQPIKVYFSSDMDYNLMYAVQQYFRKNSDPACKIGSIVPPWPKHRYTRPEKKSIFALSLLFSYDPKIRDAIANDRPYSFSISLDDLYRIIPKDRKAKERYKGLYDFLKSRKLVMTIT